MLPIIFSSICAVYFFHFQFLFEELKCFRRHSVREPFFRRLEHASNFSNLTHFTGQYMQHRSVQNIGYLSSNSIKICLISRIFIKIFWMIILVILHSVFVVNSSFIMNNLKIILFLAKTKHSMENFALCFGKNNIAFREK